MAKSQRPPRHDDLITTISDDDSGLEDEQEDDAIPAVTVTAAPRQESKKRKADPLANDAKRRKHTDDLPELAEKDMNPDFEFQVDDGMAAFDDFDAWATAGPAAISTAKDIDDIVARRRNKDHESHTSQDVIDSNTDDDDELLADDAFGVNIDPEDQDDDDNDDESNPQQDSDDDEDDDDDIAEPKAHPDDLADNDDAPSDDDAETPAELEKRNAFFAQETPANDATKASGGAFVDMSLSRPILRGLAAAGLTNPTPIQRRAIPVAMLGKDLVGSAVTGSGKTAAFVVPILERLLYRSREASKSRVVILMPTRELALQCFAVATKLASFTDITFAQAIGGLNQKEQERALRLRPDIVIATPGRFIDFMRNTSALALDAIEILVLDEADRMLEDGFADELNEILATLPRSRQTMLFSATMTSSVDNLIRVGLNRPVRLQIDSSKQTVSGLTQEFVRLRPGREKYRLGTLFYLCSTTYSARTIIFFRQKQLAHRVRILFALLGLSAAELHGSMSQDQRMSAMDAFRSGKASFLLATDLASRGLDIKNVQAVINYEAPQSHEIYLHRVGRTARAGRTGRACTLAAEADRKVVKQAVKSARGNGAMIRSRVVDAKDAESWQSKIDALEDEIEAVLREEKEEKVLAQTEMRLRKADNIFTHEKEILARPAKTWFQGERDKQAAKDKGRVLLNGPLDDSAAAGNKTKKKLSNKQKKKLDDRDDIRDGRLWKKGKADRQGGVKKPVPKKTASKPVQGKKRTGKRSS